MANNYQAGSCNLIIPEQHINEATKLAKDIIEELEIDKDYDLGCNIIFEPTGIVFYEEEHFNPETVATIAQTIINKFELNDFIFSWAYFCDKPRLNEFGGGACRITKNVEPTWIDAYSEAATNLN